jgi:hypothetical protein
VGKRPTAGFEERHANVMVFSESDALIAVAAKGRTSPGTSRTAAGVTVTVVIRMTSSGSAAERLLTWSVAVIVFDDDQENVAFTKKWQVPGSWGGNEEQCPTSSSWADTGAIDPSATGDSGPTIPIWRVQTLGLPGSQSPGPPEPPGDMSVQPAANRETKRIQIYRMANPSPRTATDGAGRCAVAPA